MRVHVADRFELNVVAVYIVDDAGPRRILRLLPPAGSAPDRFARLSYRWEDYDPMAATADLEPTLELPRPAWEAMVAAGAELAPADRTMATAWKDARDVRDRLLGLVERAMAPDRPEAREAPQTTP